MYKEPRILIPVPTFMSTPVSTLKLPLFHQNFTQMPKVKLEEQQCGRIISQAMTQQKLQRQKLSHNVVQTMILVDHSRNNYNRPGLKIRSKNKKIKKKNPVDYKKNICGYITKKIIRQFTGTEFESKAIQLCKKYNCNFNQAKLYYSNKIQHVTGPSHIPGLLIPQTNNQFKIKLAFRQFFEWFLREHYLRYLLNQGKMSDRKAYIDYKNKQLLYLINSNEYLYAYRNKKQIPNEQKIQQVCKQQQIQSPIKQHNIIQIPIVKRQLIQ